jgi:phage terminase large subunit GpA-like protein
MLVKDSLVKIFDDSLKKVDTDNIASWSKKNIVLPPSYADPGILDLNKSRYLLEPLDALLDRKIRNVVIYKAVQTGGTLLADIAIPYFIINKPGPILFSMYSEKMIKDHVNDRLYPLFKNCKSLKHILPDDSRDFTNYGIKFPHCTLYCDGQAESTFQAKSIKFLICDEVHLWDRGRLDLAMVRTSYFDLKILPKD